ncbi:MAG TPA: tetratricopeptide repeat protein [Gallionellaceae bacterium]|nr:tetratricopeptide repeat protein [Gallionellaceae bacterium]
MRQISITIITLLWATFAGAETQDTPPSAGLAKTGFVKEHTISGARKLIGWRDDHIFVAKQDGSIEEIDHAGHKTLTLQAKDSKGMPVLKQPEAVAAAEGVIYVADSESNLVAMFSAEGKYQGSFGAKKGGFFGGGAGVELSAPRGIAVHEGIVYVADTGNGKVQLFGINGVFLATLEIESSPDNKAAKEKGLPYKLGEPADIAVSGRGDIYVLDANDNLIKVYAPNGKYLKHLPKDGKPLALSLSAEGIYVADKDTLIIRRYDFNDKLTYSFGAKGEGRGLFKSIAGLVAGNDRQVYVGDSKKGLANVFQAEAGTPHEVLPKQASRISVKTQGSIPVSVSKMAWNGKDTIYAIDAENKAIIRIHNGAMAGDIKAKDLVPVAVAVDKNGALWALDTNNMRVVKLEESGAILASIGSKGGKKGQLDDPTDMAIAANGDIYIADRGNNWVQVFNSDGGFVQAITKSTAAILDEPVAIALDPQDNLYVLDKGRTVISVFSGKGEPLHEFGKPQAGFSGLIKPVALMATADEVFVLDSNQVRVFSHQGIYQRAFSAKGSAAGELDEPLAIAAKDSTTFFIAERGNKRVQTFVTLHKPAAPEQLVAQGAVHAVELRWAAATLPYIKQYQIYRSRSADAGFVRIGSSQNNQYADQGLAGEEQYHYRVAAETYYGFEGATSAAVQGTAQKFVPPVPVNVQVDPSPWLIKMSWQPVDKQYLSAYLIYEKEGDAYSKIGETTEAEYTKASLKPDSKYTFYISTRSTDGIESAKCAVNATTLPFNKAPLEIEVLKLRDIFSNTYKLYEEDGVGRIKLTNNTDKAMNNIKVSFVLKNVMDFPTEIKIEQILPGKSEEISLKAVFNNTILTISEDSSVQALIEASYYENGSQIVYGKNSTVTVYDKHRLTWDERGRYAAFITPKDPPIINFVRSVATQFPDAKDQTQMGAVVFDALGVAGLTYLADPTNPYQVSSGKTDVVDYIQYPRETMRRKSGDCDDLVAIYSAALESLGISTLVVEVPGHMFMMFSTGIDADADGYTNNDLYVAHKGKLWIPVETTIVGSSFVKAWELGAANYYKWKDKGLTLLDIHESWNIYKPATLPVSTQVPIEVSAKQIEKKFPGDLVSVLKISSQTTIRSYLQAIEKNPADIDAHLQAAIVLARLGDRSEAMKYFDRIIAAEPRNAAALNNRGNIFMIESDYPAAQRNYLAATLSNPEDAEIWVNLAKSYKAENNMKKSKESFARAQKLDSSIKNKYKALAMELLNTL